jgi:RNA polymerase sigma-70 factor (ECF subfamily)
MTCLLDLYDMLMAIDPSPVIALNLAVAVAMVEGPVAGFAAFDAIDQAGALSGYFLLPATRADFLRKLGRNDEAASS